MNSLLYRESLMDRMICKKGLALFLLPHTALCFGCLLESPHWGDSNKYSKHALCFGCLLESPHWGDSKKIFKTYAAWSFNAIFLHNFSLTVTSSAKVSCYSNCHYNEFCCCIECRYKEDWLYCIYIYIYFFFFFFIISLWFSVIPDLSFLNASITSYMYHYITWVCGLFWIQPQKTPWAVKAIYKLFTNNNYRNAKAAYLWRGHFKLKY